YLNRQGKDPLAAYEAVLGMVQDKKLPGVPPLRLYDRVIEPALKVGSKALEAQNDISTKQRVAAIYLAKARLIQDNGKEFQWPFAHRNKVTLDAYEAAIQLDKKLVFLPRGCSQAPGAKIIVVGKLQYYGRILLAREGIQPTPFILIEESFPFYI